MLKTPLRYPGGKSKVVKKLFHFFPYFEEYREPFVGGGSMFTYIKQVSPKTKIWINDNNISLYCFYKVAQRDSKKLANYIRKLKRMRSNRFLFDFYSNKIDEKDEWYSAVRFFILNRLTYSGVVDGGGFSNKTNRFTESAFSKLESFDKVLDGVKITNYDYSKLLSTPGKSVFLFCDPPYIKTKAKLYNCKAKEIFSHDRFCVKMKKCAHNWLITYDNCTEVEDNFYGCSIDELSMTYGMNRKRVKELIIRNYD